ncbi:hypothetical protein ACOTWR_06665 [Aliarcobacter butzleri]
MNDSPDSLKQIILDSLDKTNKAEPRNLEIALQKLNSFFSDIKKLEAYKVDANFIKIRFNTQDIAQVGGEFIMESGRYMFLNNEAEILFLEDNEYKEFIYEINDINALCEELKALGFDLSEQIVLDCPDRDIDCIIGKLKDFYITLNSEELKRNLLVAINVYISPKIKEDDLLNFEEQDEFDFDM